ncbi:unnamed protein product [Rotaria sp. Silwood2]|nr:unnamed protein product [Rotaria sp. Silwood2]
MNEISIDNYLKCPICTDPFLDPVSTPCEHTFCRQCILTWLELSKTSCPSCRETLSKKDLTSISVIFIHGMLNEIQVKCTLCGAINLQRGNFQNHINNLCPKADVSCSTNSDTSCSWIGSRDQLEIHQSECQTYQSQLIRNTNCVKDQRTETLNVNRRENPTNGSRDQLEIHQSECRTYQSQLIRNTNCVKDQRTETLNVNRRENPANELINPHELELEGHITRCADRTIELSGRLITNSDMSIVVEQAIIRKKCNILILNGNHIDASGALILAKTLSNNTSLIRLELQCNCIGDRGVDYLADALSVNKCLKVLDLRDNNITHEGARHLANMLKRNQTLTSLSLNSNHIDDRGIRLLADALIDNTSLRRLFLFQSQSISDWSIASLINMLRYNQSLEELTLQTNKLSWWCMILLRFALLTKRNFNLII